MNKGKLLLDIDGVIADFYAGFGDHLNKSLSAGLDLNKEPDNYSIHQWAPFLSREDIDKEIPRWIIGGGYKNMPIYPGAVDFVSALVEEFDVVVVTARVGDFHVNFSDQVKDIIKKDTIKWLEEHKFPPLNVVFEHKKVDFCQQNGISLIIEDKLPTAVEAVEKGIVAILMDRAWNRDNRPEHPNLYVARSYADV